MTEPLHPPAIIRHMAAHDGRFPPNSLEAIRTCLEEAADCIEIDVAALADGDFAVVHDLDLDSETTGHGKAAHCSSAEARELRLKLPNERSSSYRLPLLSDVVALMLQHPGKTRLQIDLKDVDPYKTSEPAERLARLLEPLGDRVIVSSQADWQIRRLPPWLDLGFDPGFYLAWYPATDVDAVGPPYRLGAYGYLDDHPLAARRTVSSRRYLSERCEVLLALVPGISTMYVYHGMLSRSLGDGFNWAEALHRASVRLVAWTLDTHRPGTAEQVRLLRDAGVDFFTTDTPAALAALLRER